MILLIATIYKDPYWESHVRVQCCQCATVGLFLRCSKLPFLLGRGNCTEESLDFKVASSELEGGGCPKAGWGYTWRGVGKHQNYWETPSELDVWLFLMCQPWRNLFREMLMDSFWLEGNMYVKFLIFGKKNTSGAESFDVKMGGGDFWKRSKFWKVQFRLKSAGGIGTRCPYKWLIGATTKPPLRIEEFILPTWPNKVGFFEFMDLAVPRWGQWFSTYASNANWWKTPKSLTNRPWIRKILVSGDHPFLFGVKGPFSGAMLALGRAFRI